MIGRFPHRESGFTLVEVVVALLLFVVVATGIGALVPMSVAAVHAGRDQTTALWLAVQRMEDLRALTWGFDPAHPSVPVTDTTTNLSVSPFGANGTGLLSSPTNSIDLNVPGYVDYLDAAGVWVGNGAAPPPAAVFIRRWNISPLASHPADGLVLQVMVTSVRRDARLLPLAPRLPHLVDAVVTTMRTRVGSWG